MKNIADLALYKTYNANDILDTNSEQVFKKKTYRNAGRKKDLATIKLQAVMEKHKFEIYSNKDVDIIKEELGYTNKSSASFSLLLSKQHYSTNKLIKNNRINYLLKDFDGNLEHVLELFNMNKRNFYTLLNKIGKDNKQMILNVINDYKKEEEIMTETEKEIICTEIIKQTQTFNEAVKIYDFNEFERKQWLERKQQKENTIDNLKEVMLNNLKTKFG